MILTFFKNRWVRLIIHAGMVLLAIALARSSLTLWNKKDIVDQRRQVLVQLEAENQKLKKQLAETQAPGFVERVAREALGLVKEGETVVLIRPVTQSDQSDQLKTEETVPNWKRWWGLFF